MQGAPQAGPQEGGDPIAMLAEMSMQALQAQDCGMAMQVCEAFVQLVQQAMGNAPQGPVGSVPENSEPIFKKGGVLKGYKKKKGCK